MSTGSGEQFLPRGDARGKFLPTGDATGDTVPGEVLVEESDGGVQTGNPPTHTNIF